MPTLQVRDVPPEVHRALKARAAASGRSLSEYTLEVLKRETARPTVEEMVEHLSRRRGVDLGGEAVTLLRRERDDR